MTGYTGFTKENNVFFQFSDVYIECYTFEQLTKINKVLHWNVDGTIVLDTNYGGEAYCVQDFMDDLVDNKNICHKLKDVTEFKVIRGDCYDTNH